MRTGMLAGCLVGRRLRLSRLPAIPRIQNLAEALNEVPQRSGFTLVEVIITLLVAMILGTIVYQYMGSSLSRSGTSLKRQQARLQLNSAAENIIGAFRQSPPASEADWNSLRGSIGAAGTTQSNSYGQYEVVINAFIQFDASGMEAGDVYGTPPENILKIALQNAAGEQLMFLLIK